MHTVLQRIAFISVGLLTILGIAAPVAFADGTWPREIQTDRGLLTIYQPQPEKLDGNVLQGRAAVSLLAKDKTSPVFGVFWFTSRVDTDRSDGTSMVRNIVVTNVRWPNSQAEEESKAATFLTTLMAQTEIPLSLERLKASLATAETERKSLEGLKHDPPKIIVVQEIAELLQYDGQPRGVPIPNTQLEQIANAPFAVVRDKSTGDCYLSGGKIWYKATDPKGPWTPIDKPPADIAKLVPPDTTSTPAPAEPPRIVVATEPSELISTDGPPAWKPIGKGELLYIENTESSVVREVATGKVFVLISGRWYTTGSLDAGPWVVVRPDELPASFKDIPPASDLGAARVSIAGTPEAEEAMLDAEVPQTAAIDRKSTKLEVEYDGEPQFKNIEGTDVAYATNTAAQVLRIDGTYYACDNGVWFVSDKATGTWAVADSVPEEKIQKIPPSEPVYNVTYVKVYEATPTVVYVGYTPGYMWSAQPATPSTRPAQPSTRPSQPASPSTRPTQPSTRPSTRPAQPPARPSQPPSNLNRDHRARQKVQTVRRNSREHARHRHPEGAAPGAADRSSGSNPCRRDCSDILDGTTLYLEPRERLPHRHSRISARSSPCSAMYSLFSSSFSRIACFA